LLPARNAAKGAQGRPRFSQCGCSDVRILVPRVRHAGFRIIALLERPIASVPSMPSSQTRRRRTMRTL
jgi:hypothetical protein